MQTRSDPKFMLHLKLPSQPPLLPGLGFAAWLFRSGSYFSFFTHKACTSTASFRATAPSLLVTPRCLDKKRFQHTE
jgi:hypothetical protein